VLVLASGGLDSSACLQYHVGKGRRVRALHVGYGQMAAERELDAAKAVCEYYGVALKVISLTDVACGQGEILGRNAFLLSAAMLTLQKHRSALVAIGIHAGTAYADCTREFMKAMQRVFDLYADGRLIIDAPFVEWSKRDIYDFVGKASPIHSLTYSCELGGAQPCCECVSCRDIKALEC
jgi:7-cyano-7-deazaguanine synthase